jgi:branched-chain amino acid transport system ATP-binding protein
VTELLEVDSIHTYYGDALVLEGTTLSVPTGGCVAVVGRNGVGKTTLARTVMGLTPVRRGTITLAGVDISRWSPRCIAQAGVSLVPQGRRIFGSLTVEENLRVVWQRSRASRLNHVYQLFPRLQERRHQRGGSLSGGEQQMLAVGRAIMSEPKLMILDEPTEGLGPLVIQTLLDSIRHLRNEGIAVMLMEQRINFATALAEGVVVLLNRGQVTFRGDVAAFESWRASNGLDAAAERSVAAHLLPARLQPPHREELGG